MRITYKVHLCLHLASKMDFIGKEQMTDHLAKQLRA